MTKLATVLLIIGGLNWGSVGLFDFNFVSAIFGGPASLVTRIVYVLVGLAGIYEIFALRDIGAPRARRPGVESTYDRGHRTPLDRVA